MRVIVIGGVAAGMSAASRLKRLMGDEVQIAVYEKGSAVSYGACGIPYYIAGKIDDENELVAKTPEQFRESGIDLRLRCEVTAVNVTEKTVNVLDLQTGGQSTETFDKLIIGSGARVKTFPPLDTEADNLYKVRDMDDAVGIRRALAANGVNSVAIIGGGFIGLEIADACIRQGKRVSVIEASARVLRAMDREITDKLTRELVKNGVDVYTGVRVHELGRDGRRVTGAVIETGGEKSVIDTDIILNCAGITPNTEFIENIEKTPGGAIIVDEHMHTSAPDIYAAGDCSAMRSFITGNVMHAPLGTNANKQGRMIADEIAGLPVPQLKLIGSSALRLFSLDAGKTGLSEEDAAGLGLDYGVNVITGNSFASYYGTEKVTVKLVYERESRRILGAQAVGQGIVAPRVNYFAIAISAGMTVDEFGLLDLCYSPPFGGVWDVSLIAANTAK